MESLKIEATSASPYISFDSENHVLEVRGESYPENTSEFYQPVFKWLGEYLEEIDDSTQVKFNLELIYFNSSSSKVLLDLFDQLEESVGDGKKIEVNWYYDEENEMALEYGEEFQDDLENLPFNIVPKKEE